MQTAMIKGSKNNRRGAIKRKTQRTIVTRKDRAFIINP
jgi:hypothetical protein